MSDMPAQITHNSRLFATTKTKLWRQMARIKVTTAIGRSVYRCYELNSPTCCKNCPIPRYNYKVRARLATAKRIQVLLVHYILCTF